MADYMEIVRRHMARMKASPSVASEEVDAPSAEDSMQAALAEVETACRCSKHPFPHIHSREDRQKAIREWNRDSGHKWVQ